MRSKNTVGNIVTAIMVICAISVTVVSVLQYLRSRNLATVSTAKSTRYIKDWKGLTRGRLVNLGSKDASLKIVEFSDYECPYCREVESYLQALVAKYPRKVAVIRYNNPLQDIHHQAFKAAKAARCSELQGNLRTFEPLLFKVDLATVNWTRLAAEGGIKNISDFENCLDEPSTAAYVQSDLLTASNYGIKATPEFIINGELYVGELTLPQLEQIISVTPQD